jgi:hypothetical protein
MTGRRVGVLGMGTHLPPTFRTKAHVVRAGGVTAEWITESSNATRQDPTRLPRTWPPKQSRRRLGPRASTSPTWACWSSRPFTPDALGQADVAHGHGPPPGERVLMAVFGADMTWGSALLAWSGARDHPCFLSPPVPNHRQKGPFDERC